MELPASSLPNEKFGETMTLEMATQKDETWNKMAKLSKAESRKKGIYTIYISLMQTRSSLLVYVGGILDLAGFIFSKGFIFPKDLPQDVVLAICTMWSATAVTWYFLSDRILFTVVPGKGL